MKLPVSCCSTISPGQQLRQVGEFLAHNWIQPGGFQVTQGLCGALFWQLHF
jgi:hypothetical protein